MLTKVGAGLLVVGGLAALVGAIWGSTPHPDANIGAGLLVVLGLPVAGVGILLLVVGVIVRSRRR